MERLLSNAFFVFQNSGDSPAFYWTAVHIGKIRGLKNVIVLPELSKYPHTNPSSIRLPNTQAIFFKRLDRRVGFAGILPPLVDLIRYVELPGDLYRQML
jgi:hypothetical protein